MTWNNKPTTPRKARGGIKALDEKGEFAKNWWARRWLRAMENLMAAARLQRGQSYARLGQVLSIEEHRGVVVARVQGSRSKPYKVTIRLMHFNNAQWERVFKVLSGKALFAAQLLSGEMPPDIEDAFSAARVNLFPTRAGDLLTECSCPDWANPCKHIAAAHYILGNRFDEDPFLLFRLRGRTQEQVLEGIRRYRSSQYHEEEIPSQAEIPIEEDREEIEESTFEDPCSLENFWQMQSRLEDYSLDLKPPDIPLPIFRRLGEPDIARDESMERMLEDGYNSVSQWALLIAYHGSESPSSPANGEE
jgi:uncharacterized Zn finger protein